MEQNPKNFLNSDEFKEIQKDFTKAWNDEVEKLEENLNTDMVEYIRLLRCGDGSEDTITYSWRAVARMFVEKYPTFSEEFNILAGNQLSGMQLCEAAQSLLKQDTIEGWN